MWKPAAKILRWLALNYRMYEYLPPEAEIRGRFISRKPFPRRSARRQIGETARRQDSVPADCLYGLIYSLYVEGNVYLRGAWYRIFL